MKKFLLSLLLVPVISLTYSQSSLCPSDIFRENGGGVDCKAYTSATGKLRLSFNTAPDPSIQVFVVLQPGTLNQAEVVPLSKEASNANKTYRWCFKSDNIQDWKVVVVQLYYDNGAGGGIAGNGIKDGGEALLNCTPEGPLPVTLANFDAAQKSGKVTLTWNTLMELNNDGFEIERRIGTGAYQKIAFVDSKAPGGNGDAFSYSFEDNTALPKGVTYYRLKQIDFDGRASYSEIRAVRSANGTLLLSVYPNPSRGTTNVAIPAGTGMVDVTLTDFTGKSLQLWTGLNTSNLQLTNLKPGMYTLRVSVRATGETITERIAVQ